MPNNAKKGKSTEIRTAKKLNATRKAGPNRADLKRSKDRIEVKNYKNPLTKSELQKARAQNNANIIVSKSGFTDAALEHSKKNMPKTQLRSGKGGGKLVQRRK